MKKHLLITIIIMSMTVMMNAVFEDYDYSARSRAIGGAYTSTADDANAVFFNPAGLSNAGNSVNIGYSRLYSEDFNKLMTLAFSMKLPNNWGSLGLSMQSFGVEYQDVELMSEKQFGLSHSFSVLKDVHSEINFGYTFRMMNLSFYELGDENTLGIDVGAQFLFHQRTKLGFSFINLNNPALGKDKQHELPQKLAFGISYIPYDKVITAFDIKKEMNGPTELHAGIEINLYEILYLRTGLRNEPVSFSAGFGVDYMNVKLDYSINTHAELGLTHYINVGYLLK
ncbi:MAG: hypothetical protein PHR06_05235 [Candidatus Cloacimonetes bacterium]|nr:hypothetical protein [Candidatus Cloacimonadota bacterium]